MSQIEPPPLQGDANTPEELARALRALRDHAGDAARIERVAQKLGPLLDAAPGGVMPPSLQPAVWSARVLRFVLAGLCLGTAMYWLLLPGPVAKVATVATPRAVAPPTAPLARESTASEPKPSSSDSAPPEREASEPALAPSRTKQVASKAKSSRAVPSTAAGLSTTRAASEALAPAHPESPATSEATQAKRPPAPTPAEQTEPSMPKSEIELLLEARKLMRDRPREALRLLDEHGQRFGEGMLAPEREVMAIEILRGLGQKQLAEARLTRFRASHPGSLHLRRLEQGPQ